MVFFILAAGFGGGGRSEERGEGTVELLMILLRSCSCSCICLLRVIAQNAPLSRGRFRLVLVADVDG